MTLGISSQWKLGQFSAEINTTTFVGRMPPMSGGRRGRLLVETKFLIQFREGLLRVGVPLLGS